MKPMSQGILMMFDMSEILIKIHQLSNKKRGRKESKRF